MSDLHVNEQKRRIHIGIEEPALLLFWTVNEVAISMSLWFVISKAFSNYVIGMGAGVFMLIILLQLRDEMSARGSSMHFFNLLGIWKGSKSLDGKINKKAPHIKKFPPAKITRFES